MAMEAAELARKQAEKVKEVKQAEAKLKDAQDRLKHALATDHLVENSRYNVQHAANELTRKKNELARLK